MSDFAAVAESDRFPAKWAAGDAKENELVLSADFGEGTFLSGSVWESAEGDEKPWHCIFRFSQEDMQLLDLRLVGLQQAQGLLRRPLGEIGVGVSQERLLGLLQKPCSRDGRFPRILAWMLRAAYAHDHVLLYRLDVRIDHALSIDIRHLYSHFLRDVSHILLTGTVEFFAKRLDTLGYGLCLMAGGGFQGGNKVLDGHSVLYMIEQYALLDVRQLEQLAEQAYRCLAVVYANHSLHRIPPPSSCAARLGALLLAASL